MVLPLRVLASSDELEVGHVAAAPVEAAGAPLTLGLLDRAAVAGVIDVHAGWDGADERLVDPAVDVDGLGSWVRLPSGVPVGALLAHPQQASVGLRLGLSLEAGHRRSVWAHTRMLALSDLLYHGIRGILLYGIGLSYHHENVVSP